jgi:transposase
MKDLRCLDYRKAIKESEARLRTLEQRQRLVLFRDRMYFLWLLKSGECTTQAEAGAAIGLSLRGAEKLWKKYRLEGLAGLLRYPFTGKKEKLSGEQKGALQAELLKDESQTLEQIRGWVQQHYGVHYSLSAMYYVLGRMKIKKKTGRPQYLDKDQQGEAHFKKKLS